MECCGVAALSGLGGETRCGINTKPKSDLNMRLKSLFRDNNINNHMSHLISDLVACCVALSSSYRVLQVTCANTARSVDFLFSDNPLRVASWPADTVSTTQMHSTLRVNQAHSCLFTSRAICHRCLLSCLLHFSYFST